MMITKRCIFDILSAMAKSSNFEVSYRDKYILPDVQLTDLVKLLDNKYTFELLAYCCLLLYEDKFIKAVIRYERDCFFNIVYLQGLTLKGYELLETLNNQFKDEQ